jgi:hypothetical protein
MNNVPVRRGDQIIAVLENVNGDLPADHRGTGIADDSQPVTAAMRRLASDMLIEAAHPLDDLVRALLEPPHYRLVVSRHIDAIVTPSDLRKLPMRVLVYAQLAHLEATMLATINALFPTDEDAVSALEAGAQAQLLHDLSRMHDKHLDPPLLELTSLKQKGLILLTREVFSGSPNVVADELDDLYDGLRNPLVHAASYVNDSLPALTKLSRQLGAIARWTDEAAAAAR